MTWRKGQSGNPGGRPTEKVFADMVRLAVDEDDGTGTGTRKLRRIAEKLVEAALAGQPWAIQQVADRLDGKPAQEATVTVSDRHAATDWTREELVALLNELQAQEKSIN